LFQFRGTPQRRSAGFNVWRSQSAACSRGPRHPSFIGALVPPGLRSDRAQSWRSFRAIEKRPLSPPGAEALGKFLSHEYRNRSRDSQPCL